MIPWGKGQCLKTKLKGFFGLKKKKTTLALPENAKQQSWVTGLA